MTAGIAAVQARIGELRQLVEPRPVTTGRSPSASAATFGAALAAAEAAVPAAPVPTAPVPAAPVPAAPVPAAPGQATGQDLVAAATAYLGVPYVWGGESLDEGGLDCSGLVQRALADVGITDVPRIARQQMTLGTAVPSLDQALPGDLVVLGGGSHIGIYVGDGRMIDAPKPGKAVTVRDVYAVPTAIRRVLPQAGEVTTVAASTAVAAAQRAALEALAGLGAARSGVAA